MQLHRFLLPICIGLGAGMLTRLLLIQTAYRQFPSRPHGLIIHLFLGAVASLLGALVIPAVIKPDFTAGVFVSIGTSQFHTMRDLERQAWAHLDEGEPVPRGSAYIEGMAAAFEARIFLVLGVASLTTLVAYVLHWPFGVAIGAVLAVATRWWRQGKNVGDLANVRVSPVELASDGCLLVEGKVVVRPTTSIQPADVAQVLGVVIEPRDFSGVLTLAHRGQQQAILHNLAVAVGVQTQLSVQPTVTYYPQHALLLLLLAPVVWDEDVAVKSIVGAPILEGLIRKSMLHAGG